MDESSRSFAELLADLLKSTDEVAALSKSSQPRISDTVSEFSVFVEKLKPIFNDLKDEDDNIKDMVSIHKALESLETELKRAISLIRSSSFSRTSTNHRKRGQELTHDLGRCLGLVVLASLGVSPGLKERIGVLHKEMMNAKFEVSLEQGFGGEEDGVEEGEEEERIVLGVDEVALQVKYCSDEELKFALLGLNSLILNRLVGNEWISDQGIIRILIKRLDFTEQNNRLIILQILRRLVSENEDNKEKMVDVGYLSIMVNSLSANVEESREAVGLLLALSDVLAVRRSIGRIKGCIVMLVGLLSGDDPVASHDAKKLLSALSGYTQDVLHMAEAGYFKPLVHHLKHGSDMSKILMATALSRMVLTDSSRAAIGDEGSIKPLVRMFSSGKLEAKFSALGALKNLSISTENVQRLVSSGIVTSLLQLLFSVTSVLMTLREPVSAILASIAKSESILVNQDVAQQMLSLLTLSGPTVQNHLLCALNSIASHSSAATIRTRMKENGALQLLLPFLTENRTEIRTSVLNLLYNLTTELSEDLTEQLGETYLKTILDIISTSTCENEKAAAVGLLSNLPVSDKKATDILKKAHTLPILISVLSLSTGTTTPTRKWIIESIAGILVRFTIPSDKKLQHLAVEQGVIPWLVKLLSIGSPTAKSRAATSLAQLSQNSLSLNKSKVSRWSCVPPSSNEFCEVHDGYCSIKSSFCLFKAGAIAPLIGVKTSI